MSRDLSSLLNRRHALALFGAAVATRLWAATPGPPLRVTMIDHVEFWVSDPARSAAFYARVFGNTILKNNRTTRRYVKLGPAFVAMDQGPQLRVDHFCAGIEAFQIAALHSFLEQGGIAYKDYPSGRDLYVSDPDGTHMQLGAEDSWNQLLSGTASVESLPVEGEPIFRPAGLDHILLNVSDQQKATAFYEKLLGPVAQRNNNRIWFQAGKTRVGLLQTPAGQSAGVNHFCISAAAFEYDAVLENLEQAGAKLQAPEVAGAPEFRDPDGYLVQVMRTR